jgi:uracil-DNA glycosylase
VDYKIALVGEAWGADEERLRQPFVGKAGQFLNAMLQEAGINRSECYVTNVFNLRPQGNDIKTLCGKKDSALPGWPALTAGKYIRAEFAPELKRLSSELEGVRPNLVVALGGTAAWALLHKGNISKIRGCCDRSPWGWKVLPVYHPAGIMREYENRAVTVIDFRKAAREMEFPELRRPLRYIHIVENADDLLSLYVRAQSAKDISYDIENNPLEITCIGFAFTESEAWVVPFVDPRKPKNHYWPTKELEVLAWSTIRKILALPPTKIAQNQLYDLKWLVMRYGARVNLTLSDDTMLLHHALQPELEKGLGFLGSVYTNDVAWKTMRPRGKHSIKREE